MKNHFIINSVRKALILQLIFPLLLLIVFAEVLIKVPKDNFFNPRPLNYKSNYENFYNKDLPHVVVSVPSLEYSGLDYVVEKKLMGHYYYTLVDGRCQFYLLSSESGTPAQSLPQMWLRGCLIVLDDLEYEALTKNMALFLGWTADSLRAISSPYIVSTLPYPFYVNYLFYITLYGGIIIALADIFYLFACILQPLRAPAFCYLGSFKRRKELFPKIGSDIRHSANIQKQTLFLTPEYFISTNLVKPLVLPTACIVQMYYETPKTNRGENFMHSSFTLCIIVNRGKAITFSGYKEEELAFILENFRHGNVLCQNALESSE